MIRQILEKWFGIEPNHCEACEILRAQLDESNRERKDLLHRLLDKANPEPLSVQSAEEPKPVSIGNQYVPWRVRQQMLEQEDRKTAQLIKQRAEEIKELEKELEINQGTAAEFNSALK